MKYYVGTSTDPKYPGIISGPFKKIPKLVAKHHYIFVRTKGRKFKRIESRNPRRKKYRVRKNFKRYGFRKKVSLRKKSRRGRR